MVANLALQYPVGASNEALRSAIVRLVDVLRTLQTDANQEAAIDALEASLGSLTTTVNTQGDAITAAQGDISTIEGDITNLSAADDALNSAVDSVLATVGLVQDDVAALQSNELTPQERFEIALDHAIDTVQGSRREWQAFVEQQIVNVFDALAQLYRDQQDDAAAITVEQTVRVSENEAFAQQITSITADLASTSAAIVTEQTARADGDSALASDIASVTSTANGNTASINTLSTSIDGIHANWTVALNANDRVTGMVTLDGNENTSTFAVLADKFTIVHPTANGTTMQAFTTGLVNGVATVGINGNLVIDGTVLARHIAAGQITAAKIAAGTITSAEIAAGGINADRLNVTSLSAVSANAGTITAGVLQSADGNFVIDLNNKTITITA